MSLRFRRSIKLAPGIRWNFSGSGSSWTIGPRGASIGIGKRGMHLNSGIPGTGLYSRSRLTGAPSPQRAASAPASTTVSMSCSISDDGTLTVTDKSGAPVSEHLIELAKKQNRDAILGLIQRKCDEINGQIEALGTLHHDTPAPRPPTFTPQPFEAPRPQPPTEKQAGILSFVIPGARKKVEEENRAAAERYAAMLADWEAQRAAHDRAMADRKDFITSKILRDVDAMGAFLEENLSDIAWPRETLVAFEINDAGAIVALDVDLPEVEDMPSKLAAVPSRGLKLAVKDLGATKVRKLYADHIHGIVFRIIGEAFAALPAAKLVTVSGYSQRRDPGTGQQQDDYLLSARVTRDAWSTIDFGHLQSIDPVEALQRFDLRRDMSKSGIFKPIAPHK